MNPLVLVAAGLLVLYFARRTGAIAPAGSAEVVTTPTTPNGTPVTTETIAAYWATENTTMLQDGVFVAGVGAGVAGPVGAVFGFFIGLAIGIFHGRSKTEEIDPGLFGLPFCPGATAWTADSFTIYVPTPQGQPAAIRFNIADWVTILGGQEAFAAARAAGMFAWRPGCQDVFQEALLQGAPHLEAYGQKLAVYSNWQYLTGGATLFDGAQTLSAKALHQIELYRAIAYGLAVQPSKTKAAAQTYIDQLEQQWNQQRERAQRVDPNVSPYSAMSPAHIFLDTWEDAKSRWKNWSKAVQDRGLTEATSGLPGAWITPVALASIQTLADAGQDFEFACWGPSPEQRLTRLWNVYVNREPYAGHAPLRLDASDLVPVYGSLSAVLAAIRSGRALWHSRADAAALAVWRYRYPHLQHHLSQPWLSRLSPTE